MDMRDAMKFAMADLVARNMQQQGGITQAVLTTGKQFLGIGAAQQGAENQSYAAGLSGGAAEAAMALHAVAASAQEAAQSLRGGFSGGNKLLGGDSGTSGGIPFGGGPEGGWKLEPLKRTWDAAGKTATDVAASGEKAAGTLGGEAAGGVAEAAEGAATSLGGIALAGLDIAAKFVGLTVALKDFGDGAVEANRHLGQWNGLLAVANARYDIQTSHLEQETAHATGGSAAMLTGEQMDLREQFQPIAEDLATLKNIGVTTVVEIAKCMTGVLNLLDAVFGPLLRATEKYLSSGESNLPIAGLFDFFERQNMAIRQQDIAGLVSAQKHAARAHKVDSARKRASTVRSVGGAVGGAVGGTLGAFITAGSAIAGANADAEAAEAGDVGAARRAGAAARDAYD